MMTVTSLTESTAPLPASREKVELITQLCAELAHYNNNVLGVARANLSLIRVDGLIADAEGQEMLNDAMEALDRLELLSAKLEIFACYGAFRDEVFDLGRWLHNQAEDLRSACGRRVLHLDIAAEPMAVRGDPRLLMAAIKALLPDATGCQPDFVPQPVTLRCEPLIAPTALQTSADCGVELSLACNDYSARPRAQAGINRLLSRTRGYLELGVWFARELARASGGSFHHAQDERGRPGRMVLRLPTVSLQERL